MVTLVDMVASIVVPCVVITSIGHAQTELTLATGSPTGVYYPLGQAIKTIVEKTNPDLRIRVLSTHGSIENAKKLLAGEVDFAFVQSDTAYYFSEGRQMSALPSNNMRGVASLYTEYIHIVARKDRGISEIQDLKNKRVRTTSRTDRLHSDATNILKVAGFEFSDIVEERLTFDKSYEALIGGSIDAAFLTAGIPTPVVEKLAHKIRFVPIRRTLASAVSIK